MDKIKLIEAQSLKKDVPVFKAGDEVKVYVKMVEGDKIRVHHFDGTVIRRRGQGISASFTVRKVSAGEGVERTFFVNSPSIEKIQVGKQGKVNRAKIYYLRKRFGKAARIEEQELEIAKPQA